jgi:uncharacterized protein YutE (UPF0331/DUF86 family)
LTEVDAPVIRRKLRRIRANLETLVGAIVGITVDAYAADELRRRAVERLLQETIDAVVDVNNLLLRGAGLAPAEDYYRNFLEVGRAGIIDASFALSLAPSAGLRNRIVHEYEDLDHALVLRAARGASEQLRRYVGAIEEYLAGRGV